MSGTNLRNCEKSHPAEEPASSATVREEWLLLGDNSAVGT